MRHFLDVNVLLAGIITSHPHHALTVTWLKGKEIVLCPISELGFIRISSHKRAYGLPMEVIRQSLKKFSAERKADWIPDDLPALGSHPSESEHVTDYYLANLAAKHGLKLATLDEELSHPSVVLVF